MSVPYLTLGGESCVNSYHLYLGFSKVRTPKLIGVLSEVKQIQIMLQYFSLKSESW